MINKNSYNNVLKSTAVIGGASLLSVVVGMIRIKFAAILLGPLGLGLIGIYTQITSLAITISDVGLGNSGVRQVSVAAGSGDNIRISRTIISLRRITYITGFFGTLMVIILCVPISQFTFSEKSYASEISLLGFTVLITAITSVQTSILRGMGRIWDLSRLAIISAVFSVIVSVPLFYFLGNDGIVISIIFCAVVNLIVTRLFARRVPIMKLQMSWLESRCEVQKLLSLGVGVMGAGIATVFSAYLIRIIILRQFSIDSVGIYQAAFSIAAVMVSFILQALSADFYPRLSSVSSDNAQIKKMVNQQTEIMVLLALPGLLIMMVLAPSVISIFYSKSFVEAIPLLRLFLLGTIFSIISWPLKYVILAKGIGRLFFLVEIFSSMFHVIMVYFFIKSFGIIGSGLAFLVYQSVYTVILLVAFMKISSSCWRIKTFIIIISAITTMGVVMANSVYNSNVFLSLILSAIVTVCVIIISITILIKRPGVSFWNSTESFINKKFF